MLADLDPLVLAARQQRQRRHRLALRAGGDHADLARRVVVDVLDVDERRVGDRAARRARGPCARSSSCSARAWRRRGRSAMAASAICWMRWMWLAKLAVMIRRPALLGEQGAQHRADAGLATARGRAPRRWSSRPAAGGCPRSTAIAPMRARSVRRPSTGVRSSLKSPECRITPCGVWKAMACAWGTEWVTGMNSTSNGPILRRSPSSTAISSVLPEQAGLLDAVAGQAERERRAVDREAAARAAGTAARRRGPRGRGWRRTPSMRSAFSRSHVKSGSTRSMPCMSGSGNISPQSISRIRPSLLDRHAVAADLAEPAEEDHPNRISHQRAPCHSGSRRTVGERISPSLQVGPAPRGLAPRRTPGASPIGSRHWPTGRPRWRIIALVGIGLGASSPVSNAKLSSIRAVDQAGTVGVALLPAGRTSPGGPAPVQCVATPTMPTAPTGQQRQRHRVVAAVDLEAAGARADHRGGLARVAGGVLQTRRCWAPRGTGCSSVAELILRPVRIGMS